MWAHDRCSLKAAPVGTAATSCSLPPRLHLALLPFCDVAIRVPATVTPEVQERHVAVYHAVCGMVEEEFFAE